MLWAAVVGTHELDPHELAVLELAAHQADDVAALEVLIGQGLVVQGAAGQDRLTPAISEARQARLAVGKLLSQLALPADEADVPVTETSKRAKKAADARWSKRRATEANRARLRSVKGGGDDGAA